MLAEAASGNLNPQHQKFVAAVVKDLQAHKGAAVVIPGDNQPPAVHALAHAMNTALGATGNTVIYTDPVEAKPQDQTAALKNLVERDERRQGRLAAHDGRQSGLRRARGSDFADAMDKVPLRVQHGLYQTRPTITCTGTSTARTIWRSGATCAAFDGTATVIQPLIAPLYNGKSEYEFIFALIGSSDTTGYDIVRKYWQGQMKGDFEPAWRKALNDGFIANTAFAGEERFRRRAAVLPADQQQQAAGDGSHLPPRSADLRRQPRQQCLAAGNAQADYEYLLGQCGAHQSESGQEDGPEDRRRRRD